MKQGPNILTVGGLDACGQTGIIADRNSLMSLRLNPIVIASSVTLGPSEIAPIDIDTFRRQLAAFVDLSAISTIKTGILAKRDIIEELATLFEDHKNDLPELVVDVCLETEDESQILSSSAISLLKMRMFPLATITIAYLSEAERLSGIRIEKIDDIKEAAEAIQIYGSKFVLIKADKIIENELVDILYDGNEHHFLFTKNVPETDVRRVRDIFSSGVAAYLAKSYRLKMAIEAAKDLTLSPRLLGQEKPA